MMNLVTARVAHGPCATCGRDILPGDRYRPFAARATKAEHEDPNIPTFNQAIIGPSIGLKRHADCKFPEDRK